ncbi:MAG: hypothetical protein ACFFDV_04655 [Candidatus Thorarchaeota archaeon]
MRLTAMYIGVTLIGYSAMARGNTIPPNSVVVLRNPNPSRNDVTSVPVCLGNVHVTLVRARDLPLWDWLLIHV